MDKLQSLQVKIETKYITNTINQYAFIVKNNTIKNELFAYSNTSDNIDKTGILNYCSESFFRILNYYNGSYVLLRILNNKHRDEILRLIKQ